MDYFYQLYNSMLKESPDGIKSLGLDFMDEQSIPVTFHVFEGVITYSTQPTSHMELRRKITDIISSNRNIEKIKRKLKDEEIFIINEKESFYHPNFVIPYFERLKYGKRDTDNLISGRLFGVDNGYICFWQRREIVLNNLNYIEQFIRKVGGDPRKVKWEIGESKLVSYDEYISSEASQDKVDDNLRMKEYNKHIIAGMKKATETETPPQPKVDLEAKYKTTIGDSNNLFYNIYDKILLSEEERVLSFNGRFGYTEVIKNPTYSEIASMVKKDLGGMYTGVIVTVSNFYVFDRNSSYHDAVARKLGLDDFIGGVYNGRDWFFVTDSTTRKYKNPEIVRFLIKKHLPEVKDISFHGRSDVRESFDYRGVHKAPSKSYGAPLHDLTQIYPDDIYSDKAALYYGDNRGSLRDKRVIEFFRSVRGQPDKLVKIYRAAPKKSEGTYSINSGDWVTLSKNYAIEHGKRHLEDFDVIEKVVPAKTLYTDANSIYEFGYNEDEIQEGMNIKLPYEVYAVRNQDQSLAVKKTIKTFSKEQARLIFLKLYPEYNNDRLYTVYAELQYHNSEKTLYWD